MGARGDGALGGVEITEGALRRGVEERARVGRADVARRAREEPDAEARLEAGDASAPPTA